MSEVREMDREKIIEGLKRLLHSGKMYDAHLVIDTCKAAIVLLQKPVIISRWVKVTGDFTTPGGTPYFVCGQCGGSGHLYGVEYRKRKVLCDGCGSVNIYPWEQAHEVGSSLWEEPKGADKD